MDLKKSALILEGGGLRGIYTSGVLRFFMDKNIYFPYVIGVSMGACNAANYVSNQPERNRIVNTRFVNDPRYLSYTRLLIKGELFGMKFIFSTIPHSLVPFDFKTFKNNDQLFVIVTTDCSTGEPVYFEKKDIGDDILMILQASTSLPFIAKPIRYRGRKLLDGGLSDSVPVRKSISDGNQKNILVLTQPKGYRKKISQFSKLARLKYPGFKGLANALASRHIRYNETMALIDRLEDQRKVFVIRPGSPLKVHRAERNKDKLYRTYDKGYNDALFSYSKLCRYLMDDPVR